MHHLKIILIDSVSPYHNLAYESTLYEALQPEEIVVLLWKNSDAVIIGRAQNPWLEVNLNYLKTHDIPLVRRNSGGGTVYHDQGNINFTLMAHKPLYKNTIATHIVNATLNDLGFNTTVNKRNDILLHHDNQEFKISGSAYRETMRKGLHHGTILVNANIPKLKEALHPHNPTLISNCIKSVRVPVMNLSTIDASLTIDQIMPYLVMHFTDYFMDTCSVEVHNIEQLPQTEAIHQEIAKLKSREWTFGKTPKFTQHFLLKKNDQSIQAEMEVNQGVITDISLTLPEDNLVITKTVQQTLIDQPYHKESIKNRLDAVDNIIFSDALWSPIKTMLIEQID